MTTLVDEHTRAAIGHNSSETPTGDESIVSYMRDAAHGQKIEALKDALDNIREHKADAAGSFMSAGKENTRALIPFLMAAAGRGDIMQAFLGMVMATNASGSAIRDMQGKVDKFTAKERDTLEKLKSLGVVDEPAEDKESQAKGPKASKVGSSPGIFAG